MNKLIQTLKNIWSIEELRSKILFTLMMIAIYRVGTHIVLPGIDPNQMQAGAANSSGILGLIDAFSGGAFSRHQSLRWVLCLTYLHLFLCS